MRTTNNNSCFSVSIVIRIYYIAFPYIVKRHHTNCKTKSNESKKYSHDSKLKIFQGTNSTPHNAASNEKKKKKRIRIRLIRCHVFKMNIQPWCRNTNKYESNWYFNHSVTLVKKMPLNWVNFFHHHSVN